MTFPYNVSCGPSGRMLEYFLYMTHMIIIVDLEEKGVTLHLH